MKLTALAFAVAFAILTGPAFASQCPVDMAKIDAALVTATSLTAEELETVKKLRAKGEKSMRQANTRSRSKPWPRLIPRSIDKDP